jgi:hypothetical protein
VCNETRVSMAQRLDDEELQRTYRPVSSRLRVSDLEGRQ